MPDPYINPDLLPYTGRFQWVPSGANGNSSGFGFKSTVIRRGKFRNDQFVSKDNTNPPSPFSVSTYINKGVGISTSGSEAWPIQSAFRPLQNPNYIFFKPVSNYFEMKANDNGDMIYDIQFRNGTKRITAITLTYALTVDPQDTTVRQFLDKEDKNKSPNIDWTKYTFGVIETVAGDKEKEFPVPIDNISSELTLTDYQKNGADGNPLIPKFVTKTIYFGDFKFFNDVPIIDKIRIKNRHNIPSLNLKLSKILLFEVDVSPRDRVNIDYDQVPCSYLEYCFVVDFNYDPTTQQAIVPNSDEPNFHVKVFVPENPYYDGVSGFAHSTTVKFLIFSLPVFGLANFSSTLIGLLDDINNPKAYYTVFIGPKISARNLSVLFTKDKIKNSNIKYIQLDYENINNDSIILYLEKALNYKDNTNAPNPNQVEWQTITFFESTNMPLPDKNATNGYIDNFIYAFENLEDGIWYRVSQRLSNGSLIHNSPILPQVFYGKDVLKLLQTTEQIGGNNSTPFDIKKRTSHLQDTSNINFDNIEPFAVFELPSDLGVSSPINIPKGFWDLKFSAQCSNNDFTNSHVFARMWWVNGDNSQNPNGNNLKQKTEMIFNFDNSQPQGQKTQLIFGQKPQTLENLFTTPPLSTTKTSYSFRRFADIMKQNNVIVNSANLPYSKGNLVVALYDYTYITDSGQEQLQKSGKSLNDKSPNLPNLTVSFDGASDTLFTKIRFSTSSRFLFERANRYTESSYSDYSTQPLKLTRNQYGDDILKYKSNEPYSKYNLLYNSNQNNAFNNLLTFEETNATVDNLNIVLPFNKISLKEDYQTIFITDFVTDARSLGQGRVIDGVWTIDAIFDNITIQTQKIKIKYRIEVFLATSNGKITERIFRSKWTTQFNPSNYEWLINIDTPFLISNGDIQLVVRLFAHPWSADGSNVDLSDLQNELSANNKRYVGALLQGLSIGTNTLQQIQIVQNASAGGSVAYYEDLPLFPGPTIGGEDYWLIAAENLLRIQITFPDKPLPVQAALYSPVFKTYLPKDVEVDFRTDAFLYSNAIVSEKYLKFRTVPFDDKQKDLIVSVGAFEDKTTQTIHIVRPSTNGNIKYYTQKNPTLPKSQIESIDLSDINGKLFNVLNPDIIYKKNKMSQKESLIIVGNSDKNNNPIFILESKDYGQQFKNAGINQSNNDFSILTEGLQLIKMANSSYTSQTYVSGWTAPGAIIVKSNDITHSNSQQSTHGTYYLVDGNYNSFPLKNTDSFMLNHGDINGVCVQDFSGISINGHGKIAVAYKLQGLEDEIKIRTAQEGKHFDAPIYTVVSLRKMGVPNTNTTISCPNLIWNSNSNVLHLLFWSEGKLFITKIIGIDNKQGTVLQPWLLVAGSDKNLFNNSAFNYMQQNHYLILNRDDTTSEDDITIQRAGIVSLNNHKYNDYLIVYYLYNDNKIRYRRIYKNRVSPPFELD